MPHCSLPDGSSSPSPFTSEQQCPIRSPTPHHDTLQTLLQPHRTQPSGEELQDWMSAGWGSHGGASPGHPEQFGCNPKGWLHHVGISFQSKPCPSFRAEIHALPTVWDFVPLCLFACLTVWFTYFIGLSLPPFLLLSLLSFLSFFFIYFLLRVVPHFLVKHFNPF